MADQAKMREWLLKELDYTPLDTITNGESDMKEPIKVSRMAANSALTEEYLAQKLAYEQNKTTRYLAAFNETRSSGSIDAESKNAAMDRLTRELTNEAPIRLAQVDKYYDDLVARGYYHEIRRILDYLDVSNLASIQKKLKDNVRNSARRSLDGTQEYWPVTFQPANWAQSLSSDFQPTDLLSDPDSIHSELFALYELRDQKLSQLDQLTNLKTGRIEDLEIDVNNARGDVEDAQDELNDAFTEQELMVAQTYVKYYQEANPEATDFGEYSDYTDYVTNRAPTEARKVKKFTATEFSNYVGLQTALDTASAALAKANKALAEKVQSLVIAKSDDYQGNVYALQSEVANLNRKIKFTEKMLTSPGVQTNFGSDAQAVNVSTSVATVPTGEPVGPWTTVIMSFSKSTSYSTSSAYTSSSSSRASSSRNNFWGSSYSASSSGAGRYASIYNSMQQTESTFELGMRATKVTFVRGWFDPIIFETANEMFPVRASNTPYNELLPEYPISFIIVKDVTLKVGIDSSSSSGYDSQSFSRSASRQAASTGRFWGFSMSSNSGGSSSSKSSYSSSYTNADSSNFVIKIPGPQVMCWIMQKIAVAPATTGTPPSSLPDGYLPETEP